MTFDTWIAYLLTLLVFMITPGTSHLLMISNSMSSGFKRSLSTAAGDLCANILQITVAALGLASVLASSQVFFSIVKWLGVAYLIYLGVMQFFKKASPHEEGQSRRSLNLLFWQGFLTSAANPKAVIFFAALLPQFITPSSSSGSQFLILGLTYLIVDGIFLASYGASSGWIAKRLLNRYGQYLNKVSGVFMVLAAVLLGSKEVRAK